MLDPEQLPLAMAFLAGYHPRVFDAALNAVEPCARQDAPGLEPFCSRCGAPVGIFLAHGKDYRHYRGIVTATSKPRPYKADHAPVVGWRPATDVPAAVAR
jgi:ribosomal protein S27AE